MGAARKAVEAFQDYLVRYPTSDKADQAQANIAEAGSEADAGGLRHRPVFYERSHPPDRRAAFIYYNEVVREDPNSAEAQRAKKRIQELRPLVEAMPGGAGRGWRFRRRWRAAQPLLRPSLRRRTACLRSTLRARTPPPRPPHRWMARCPRLPRRVPRLRRRTLPCRAIPRRPLRFRRMPPSPVRPRHPRPPALPRRRRSRLRRQRPRRPPRLPPTRPIRHEAVRSPCARSLRLLACSDSFRLPRLPGG